MNSFEASREFALSLDRKDPLGGFRERFNFPDDRGGRRNIYVCGNSLGLQPRLAVQYVTEVLTDWARLGVEGHFKADRPWLNYHRLAADGFAALTGAKKHEVVAMNTLTVNLHLLMASFYRPDSKRRKIVIESTAFPSDHFAVTSQLQLHGHDPAECLIEWQPRDDELYYPEDLAKILDEQGDEIALLLLPGVQYYTGQVLDMRAICELGRRYGCRVGLDLAHAVGNVPLELHEWGPDFASWCTYKYLNAGPGAIAGVFVHDRHRSTEDFLQGWWGNEDATRFRMDPEFRPAAGAEAWQMSNPPILSLAPVAASLELFQEATLPALCDKSAKLTGYLRWLIEARFSGRVGTITPADAQGCQLSLVVIDESRDARKVFERLCELNVTGDWRYPNVIRVAPVPLYNSFEDVYEFAERLGLALEG